MSTNLHFRSYIDNRELLFPPHLDQDIDENDPVRLIDSIIEGLDISGILKLYHPTGRRPYDPRMLLKVVIYAYMNNQYSCRRIEKLLKRDIHYIWLSGYEKPDFITINRFRNRVKSDINNIFTQLVLVLADKGFVSLDVEYIDGTKIESKANRYTFVWRKTVERNREKLMNKISMLLEQVDDSIAQDKAYENDHVEFTAEGLGAIISELKESLAQQKEPETKEAKRVTREKRRHIRELEAHREKLKEYDDRLHTIGERNSMSKTDPDATFMRMKEDYMRNGQTKPGYNLQISAENQFITDFALYHNPTDTLTLPSLLDSFHNRYDIIPSTIVADSGYGSEENYRFMEESGMQAYVKYNRFHMEQRPRFKPNPFHADSLHYNEKDDYYVCPMGQHMTRVGTRIRPTASGYRGEFALYRAQDCRGCPLRGMCYKSKTDRRTLEVNHRLNEYKKKARGLLTSEEGLRHRGRRCIEPEAVFGQMKYNMGYKRFRHFGKDKVNMDFAFFAIAFNLKKMCGKIAKRANNGGNNPNNGSFFHVFQKLSLQNRIFWKIPQKSAA